MPRHVQLVPYRNDEVVLYMDAVSGTNITVQPRANNNREDKAVARGIGASYTRQDSPDRSAALLETDNNPARNQPPSYGPEIDDLGPEPRARGGGNEADNRGVDEGLLPSAFPRAPPTSPRFPFDVNIYQQKKTLAQGMMDLALISANANQLRYVLQSHGHPYFLASLAMISTSLFLQVVVGIGLIWNSTYNVKKDAQVFKANKANNLTVIGIFLVTILNVFISSFGVTEPNGVAGLPLTVEGGNRDVETFKDS